MSQLTQPVATRNAKIEAALERYRGLIWKNCGRYGWEWAEDAYQQMVTKALARTDLLERDLRSLGWKLSHMALTEAAHMARSRQRGEAAVNALQTAAPTSDSFEDSLLAFDTWRVVVGRVDEDRALAYSLNRQGYRPDEIAAALGMDEQRVSRVVRDVDRAIDEALVHQNFGICDRQAELLKDYVEDQQSRYGERKVLDRRARSRLKAHLELCDTCRAHVESLRGELDSLAIAAFPLALVAEGVDGSHGWLNPLTATADSAARVIERIKLGLYGIAGRGEPAPGILNTAGAAGVGQGRMVATCGAIAACLTAGAWQQPVVQDGLESKDKPPVREEGPPAGRVPLSDQRDFVGSAPSRPAAPAVEERKGSTKSAAAERGDDSSEGEGGGQVAEISQPGGAQQSAEPVPPPSGKPADESSGGAEFGPDAVGAGGPGGGP